MTVWVIGALALMVGGLGPALWLASRGDPARRLIGLQVASSNTVLVLLLLSQADGQSQFLIVPMVLAVLSFAGTLVFIRLLAPRP